MNSFQLIYHIEYISFLLVFLRENNNTNNISSLNSHMNPKYESHKYVVVPIVGIHHSNKKTFNPTANTRTNVHPWRKLMFCQKYIITICHIESVIIVVGM